MLRDGHSLKFGHEYLHVSSVMSNFKPAFGADAYSCQFLEGKTAANLADPSYEEAWLVFYAAGNTGSSLSALSFAHLRQGARSGLSIRIVRIPIAQVYLADCSGNWPPQSVLPNAPRLTKVLRGFLMSALACFQQLSGELGENHWLLCVTKSISGIVGEGDLIGDKSYSDGSHCGPEKKIHGGCLT